MASNSNNNIDDDHYSYKILIEKEEDEEDSTADEPHLVYILNVILSGTARLNVLLPTATILAFTIFAPLLTNDPGQCGPLNRYLMAAFIAVSAASCVFFAFTDSFRSPSGRVHYGIATITGIWPFSGRRRRGLLQLPPDPERYRLQPIDLFHAMLSLVAFATFAASHHDVVGCYYPRVSRRVTSAGPLAVGFVVSVLFVVFPSRRRGIGYPFLMHRDAIARR